MIFPLAAAAPVIVVDGRPVRSYVAPYVFRGRVMAPIEPFVTQLAAGIEYSAGELIVRRGDRFAQVAMPQPHPSQYAQTFVPLAAVLRTLGISVRYDARTRRVIIRTPAPVLALPTPFNPAVPEAAPREVFTPTPAETPRPVVTGEPQPRRTPLPYFSPIPAPTPRCPRGCDRR